jgi:hypothetical protein
MRSPRKTFSSPYGSPNKNSYGSPYGSPDKSSYESPYESPKKSPNFRSYRSSETNNLLLAQDYASRIHRPYEYSSDEIALEKLWLDAIKSSDYEFIANAPLSYLAISDDGLTKIIPNDDIRLLELILDRYEINNNDDFFINLMESAIRSENLDSIKYLAERDDRGYPAYIESAALGGKFKSLELLIDLGYSEDYYLLGEKIGSAEYSDRGIRQKYPPLDHLKILKLISKLSNIFGSNSLEFNQFMMGFIMTAPINFLLTDLEYITITPIQAAFRPDERQSNELLRTFDLHEYPTPELYQEFMKVGKLIKKTTGLGRPITCDKKCIDKAFFRYIDLLIYQHPYDEQIIEHAVNEAMRGG